MQSDLPHTLYNFNSKKSGKGKVKKYSNTEISEAERLTELARQKAEDRKRKRQQKEGYTVNEIFNGDADNS